MACLSGFGAQFRLVLIPIGVATVCLTCSHIFFCVFRVTFWRLGAANRFATLPDKWLKQFRFFFRGKLATKCTRICWLWRTLNGTGRLYAWLHRLRFRVLPNEICVCELWIVLSSRLEIWLRHIWAREWTWIATATLKLEPYMAQRERGLRSMRLQIKAGIEAKPPTSLWAYKSIRILRIGEKAFVFVSYSFVLRHFNWSAWRCVLKVNHRKSVYDRYMCHQSSTGWLKNVAKLCFFFWNPAQFVYVTYLKVGSVSQLKMRHPKQIRIWSTQRVASSWTVCERQRWRDMENMRA